MAPSFINPKYYVPRPEAEYVEEQFEGDNRDLILFISGTSGVGKTTLVRKSVEKEQNAVWIECRTTTDPSTLPLGDLTENQNISCVIFDDVSELLFRVYQEKKFGGTNVPAVVDKFLSMCSSLALRRVKLVFISCNYADALRFREIFPGPGALRRITRIYLGIVSPDHAQKVLEARVNSLDPSQITTVITEVGGKLSDLVEFAGDIRSGGTASGALARMRAEKSSQIQSTLAELRCTKLVDCIQTQNLTPLQLFQYLYGHHAHTSNIVDQLIWSDIITLEPNGLSMSAKPASPLISSLLNSLGQQSSTKPMLDVWELGGEYYEYYKLGFKKVKQTDEVRCIAILSIPPSARIINTYSKKRCSIAMVKKIVNLVTNKTVNTAHSIHNRSFEYNIGATVEPLEPFDHRNVECSSGIHFFNTLEEAIAFPF